MVSVNLCSNNQSKYQVEQEYQTWTSEPTGVHKAKFTWKHWRKEKETSTKQMLWTNPFFLEASSSFSLAPCP